MHIYTTYQSIPDLHPNPKRGYAPSFKRLCIPIDNLPVYQSANTWFGRLGKRTIQLGSNIKASKNKDYTPKKQETFIKPSFP